MRSSSLRQPWGRHQLAQLCQAGVILLGHVQTAQDKQIYPAPDLEENLAKADTFERQITRRIDEYIKQIGMEAEANGSSDEAPSNDAPSTRPLLTLDLQAGGISAIIWASGYQLDFGWVQLPVFDTVGSPVHQGGVTAFPGLYFLGLPWLSKRKSSLFYVSPGFQASILMFRAYFLYFGTISIW